MRKAIYNINISIFSVLSLLIVFFVLLLILKLHLLDALLTGLLVYEIINSLSGKIKIKGMSSDVSRLIVVGIFVSIIVIIVTLITFIVITFFKGSVDNLPNLLHKMADTIEAALSIMPPWITQHFPSDTLQFKTITVNWLRLHAVELQAAGKETLKTAAHILIGIVLGILVALDSGKPSNGLGPLASALKQSIIKLETSFRFVVFAQMRISAINTFFTAIYLAVVLPLFGIHIQLVKTLVALSFITGLLPVIGNLISNSAIIIVSLSKSFNTALLSLIFLVVIHKLEYFLNAKIVGIHTKSKAWELLLAMLLMETLFGLPGLAAASIYYAYIKSELMEMRLI